MHDFVSMCLFADVCECVWVSGTHLGLCVCVDARKCVYDEYMFVHLCVSMCMWMCMHVCMCMRVYIVVSVVVCMYAHLYVCAFPLVTAYTKTHMYHILCKHTLY